MPQLRVIDTHTGGEPTRVVVEGFPDLGPGPVADQRERFRRDWDHYRRALVNEPRGSAVMVGAVLLPERGVIFFNNVGYLGMCGHGAIGVVAALSYLGLVAPGEIPLATPAGPVLAHLDASGEVSIENVPSYVYRRGVRVTVPNFGEITGDIAYGGNWFFLVDLGDASLPLAEVQKLSAIASLIREALRDQNISGPDGAEIDHVELFGRPEGPADSRNFVLCPGFEYDRSPCGTGTSAKLALLAEDGALQPGEIWRQESIVGSVFAASYRRAGDAIVPTIRGRAWVNADTTIILDESDPFCWGI